MTIDEVDDDVDDGDDDDDDDDVDNDFVSPEKFRVPRWGTKESIFAIEIPVHV